MADQDQLNNLIAAGIGGAIAIKLIDAADKPKTRTVTKVVYVKKGSRPTSPKKMKARHRSPQHGPFYLNVPKFPKV